MTVAQKQCSFQEKLSSVAISEETRLSCFLIPDISKLQGNLSVGKPQIKQSKLQLTFKLFFTWMRNVVLCAQNNPLADKLFSVTVYQLKHIDMVVYLHQNKKLRTTLIICVLLRATLPQGISTSSKSYFNTGNFKMSLSEHFNCHIQCTLFLSSPSGLLSHITYNKKTKQNT